MEAWGSKKVQMYLQLGRDWAQVENFWAGVVAGDQSLAALAERVAWQRQPAAAPLICRGQQLCASSHDETASGGDGTTVPRFRRTFRVSMAYYGLGFQGWAWQPAAAHHSVEGSLQTALQPLCEGNRPRINCAGRTDAGVSAAGQVFSFVSHDRSATAERVLAHINSCPDAIAARPSAASNKPLARDTPALPAKRPWPAGLTRSAGVRSSALE